MAALQREGNELPNVRSAFIDPARNSCRMTGEVEGAILSTEKNRTTAECVSRKGQAALRASPPGETKLTLDPIQCRATESRQGREHDGPRCQRTIDIGQLCNFIKIVEANVAGQAVVSFCRDFTAEAPRLYLERTRARRVS